MNRILLITLCLFTTTLFAQSWVQVANTPANRHHPISFSLNGKGYAVTGTNSNNQPTRRVYDYNPVTNQWGRLPNFPGAARSFGIGAVTNGFAYIGFGASNSTYFNDLWRFDDSDSSWTQLASCTCTGRRHPAMIAIGDKIYVGLGDDSNGNLNDFWMYDIPSNSWSRIANIPGPIRHHPFMFNANGNVYAGMGHGGNSIYRDWYRLDTANNQWRNMRLFPGQARVAGTQFSANGFGYVLSGDGQTHSFMNTGEFWRYDPTVDLWTQLTPHPGLSRWAPGSFVINNEVYFFGGFNRAFNTYPSDTWKFSLGTGTTGFEEANLNDFSTVFYPNPAKEVLNWEYNSKATEVRLINMTGQVVLSAVASINQLNVSELKSGLYMVQLLNGTELLSNSKVMIQH